MYILYFILLLPSTYIKYKLYKLYIFKNKYSYNQTHIVHSNCNKYMLLQFQCSYLTNFILKNKEDTEILKTNKNVIIQSNLNLRPTLI